MKRFMIVLLVIFAALVFVNAAEEEKWLKSVEGEQENEDDEAAAVVEDETANLENYADETISDDDDDENKNDDYNDENEEDEGDEEDDKRRIIIPKVANLTRIRPPIRPFIPQYRCPFDCRLVCVKEKIHRPYNWYYCDLRINRCCRRCCYSYSRCRTFGNPNWMCYQRALDCQCKCRTIKPPRSTKG